MSGAPILSVRDLSLSYPLERGSVAALSSVSFDLWEAETLAVVGESGAGKSSLALCVLGLVGGASGSVIYQSADGSTLDFVRATEAQRRARRSELALVFQAPRASLDPRLAIDEQVAEPLVAHRRAERGEALARARAALQRVGLPQDTLARRPHALSLGQAQRVALARALILEPRLLVLDEPVSALDRSVQAQILNLLTELRRTLRCACLFITHDLALVRHQAESVIVLEQGRVVEAGRVEDVFSRPAHATTRRLLQHELALPR